ncbi:MAG: UvrD-helicase domain-containing protein, partial [Gemmatimonadota bacterium]|nr:UvrD-helicase domain-containing protein [Gemmatimonadota bacterium]
GREQAFEELDRWEDFRTGTADEYLDAWSAFCYEPALRAVKPAVEFYERLRREKGLLNYSDLLLKARALLRDNLGVRKYFSRTITHILVDEFQDTDPVQAEVMLLLTSVDPAERNWTRCSPRPGSLFVVGDPKQSIYRFRRADIVTYNQVREIVLAGGGRVVTLSANFRTEAPLVDWVNRTFSGRFPGGRYSPDYVGLEPARESAAGSQRQQHGSGGYDRQCVSLLDIPSKYSNKEAIAGFEPGFTASWIREAIDRKMKIPRTPSELALGASGHACPGDFLIITYRKDNLGLYAAELERLGIPCQVTGSDALGSLHELWLLYLCLAAVTRPHDPVALVAALRSGLFGVSDAELYAFTAAGGGFNYRRPLPRSMDSTLKELFKGAFKKLSRYADWLDRLPAATAIRMTAQDSGLFARAAAVPGGHLASGSLAKAVEMLRTRAAGSGSSTPLVTDLVDWLGSLARGEHEVDGLSAVGSHGEGAVVRIMNLHKAKGLEAPVVFLADPFGKGGQGMKETVHIDRSPEGRTAGYLEFCAPGFMGRPGEPFACHMEWRHWAGEEKKFKEAEEVRLFYVAATRAGARLVITQREKRNQSNPWKFFLESLDGYPSLEDPGKRRAPWKTEGEEAALEAPEQAIEAIAGRWDCALEPGYSLRRAKELAGEESPGLVMQTADFHVTGSNAEGEHGTEWGIVIHRLLQAALQNPDRSPDEQTAAGLLDEQGLDPGLAPEALEVVRAVSGSEIYRRAASSLKCLVEVPFELLVNPGRRPQGRAGEKRTVVRGVLDLVFLEKDGWVVVDYKTDRPGRGRNLRALAEHYAPQVRFYGDCWERATGEKVRETGLYFTAFNSYLKV